MEERNLTGESKDIVSENIEILKELFPDIVVGDKIDFDKFKSNFGEFIDDSHEKYNFTWPGKTQAIRESQKQSTGTLRPCPDESKNWNSTQNLYIEGDNLEVLKLLQKSYYNKIKMIYIDPPYNTGKDFVYEDNYKDNLDNYLKISGQVASLEDSTTHTHNVIKLSTNTESNGRYHSNWLNMIYPRLKLARNLLTDDGVIFISIDINELENCKKVCNEIFGEDNYICEFVRKSGVSARLDSKYISIESDYILLYCKNKNHVLINQKPLDSDDSYKLEDEHVEERGRYKLNKMDRGSIKYSTSLDYPIDAPDGSKIYPGSVKENNGWCWRWSEKKLKWGIENDFIVIKKVNDKWNVYFKQYEKVDNNNEPLNRSLPYKNLLIDNFYNEYGSKLIKEIFGGAEYFDYPKPLELIYHLLKIGSEKNSIILDFFSGSATTAHAVMKLNQEDEGNRKFIMVQIPEATDEKSNAFKDGYMNICQIGEERIRRSGDKIVDETGNKDLDIGFKVFKLDSSNLEKWDPDYNNIQQSLIIDNIKEDRTNEDLVYEIMLKYGIDLTLPIEKHENIYSIGFGALIVCLDNNITKEITDEILNIAKNSSLTRVVFKDSGFASDAEKTNIKEILKVNNISEYITI